MMRKTLLHDFLMNSEANSDFVFQPVRMTNADFNRLSEFITREFGIKMPPVKKIMLQSRLQKRLKELEMKDFSQYVSFLFSGEGMMHEVMHMIDAVSTNKTDFFRESSHFDFLLNDLLPAYCSPVLKSEYKIWSAGCSSGEEAYTLAIVLSEYMNQNKLFDFSIFATDISNRVLTAAQNAIYKEILIANIPNNLKEHYFLRSKDREEKQVRIIPELRKKVSFARLNLIDKHYSTPDIYDIVFCRNVLIYFDRNVQERIILNLCSKIHKGGYLFLGHSESITGLDLPLKPVQPTIFEKT